MANSQTAFSHELLGCFAAGVVLHHAVFRHGEWDAHSDTLVQVIVATEVLLSLFAHELFSEDVAASLQHSALWLASAAAGLFTSMLLYRVFFHRLHHFPGPFGSRISQLYMTWKCWRRGQIYEDVRGLHQQYGDYVRVGPSEISISDPAAFNAIHSATSQCERGPWYNIINPQISLQMVRNRKEHAIRRKPWDRAFSAKALRDYEGRVAMYTDELLSNVNGQKGQPVDAAKWFNYYSFDIMGDLAFGQSFNLMKDNAAHDFFHAAHISMVLVGIFSRVVWLFPIFKSTIGRHEYNKQQRLMKNLVQRRVDNEPDVPDVFSWILNEYNQKAKPTWQEYQNLLGDASLIVVAGSDTTAATLTCLFFQLAQHPEVYRKLQKEVDEFFATEIKPEDLDSASLGKLTYLQACIDESLRLFPPVPSGLQRQTPPGGLQIGDRWIPGDTLVMTPTYTLCRDPRTFPRGDEFIPERWTKRPELVKDATPFAPFSVGRFSCVGKQLGLAEVRRVTSLIAHRYNIALAPGQTKEAFEAGLRDNFTIATPKLDMIFSHRA